MYSWYYIVSEIVSLLFDIDWYVSICSQRHRAPFSVSCPVCDVCIGGCIEFTSNVGPIIKDAGTTKSDIVG